MLKPSLYAAIAIAALASGGVRGEETTAQPSQEAVQEIFDCLRAGLPENWQRTWVVIREVPGTGPEARVEYRFLQAASEADAEGQPLVPCDAERTARQVYGLDKDLIQHWRLVKLVFYREGRYELRYDEPR